MPTQIETKKEERVQALKVAEELRAKYDGVPGPMPADDRATWEKAMDDFDALSKDIDLLERDGKVVDWGKAPATDLSLAHPDGPGGDKGGTQDPSTRAGGFYEMLNANMRGEGLKGWTTLHKDRGIDSRQEFQILKAREAAKNFDWDAAVAHGLKVEEAGLVKKLKGAQAEGYAEAFYKLIRFAKGDFAMLDDADRKVLQEGGDTSGGFLIPEDFRAELIMKLPTYTAIRPRATVLETARDIVRIPKVNYTSASDDSSGILFDSPVRLTWVGSDVPSSSSATDVTDPVFGQLAIPVNTAMAGIRITMDQLEDAAFDVMSYLGKMFVDAYNLGEDNVYINGTGQGQPYGLLNAANSGQFPAYTVTSTASNAFDGDTLIQAYFKLPIQYRAAPGNCWMMASDTARKIRILKDSQSRYLWDAMQFGGILSTALQDTLLGRPVVIDEFMPAAAASAYPVVFGDWSGYTIVDRVGLQMQVLKEVYAEVNQVKLLTRRRLGGGVTENWKFVAYQLHA